MKRRDIIGHNRMQLDAAAKEMAKKKEENEVEVDEDYFVVKENTGDNNSHRYRKKTINLRIRTLYFRLISLIKQ